MTQRVSRVHSDCVEITCGPREATLSLDVRHGILWFLSWKACLESCAGCGPGVLSTHLSMKAEREEPMLVPVCPCPLTSPLDV